MSPTAVAIANAGESFGVTQIQPVGCLINGSLKALRIYKGLEKQHRMAECLLPVRSYPFLTQRQDPGGQIWDMVGG